MLLLPFFFLFFFLFFSCFFFFNATATTEIYTLSLHDALPIYCIDYFYDANDLGLIALNFLNFRFTPSVQSQEAY